MSGLSFFLDLYHTSGKFRLVQRPRPRREPRARQLWRRVEGKDRTRAHAGHSCNAGHQENCLGRPPTRNFRRPGTETSRCRAPPPVTGTPRAPSFRRSSGSSKFSLQASIATELRPHRAFPGACGHSGHGHRHALHADQAAVRSPSVGRRSAHDPGASARSGRAMRLGAP